MQTRFFLSVAMSNTSYLKQARINLIIEGRVKKASTQIIQSFISNPRQQTSMDNRNSC